MNIGIKIDGVTTVIGKLSQYYSKAESGVRRAVAASAIEIQTRARKNITDQKAVDTGRTRSTIRAVFFAGGLVSEIGSDVHHARYIEEGRKPGRMPPPKALEGWVRRVVKPPAKAVRGVAFVIARAIGERGIEPRPFLMPAYEAEKERFIKRVKRALSKQGAT